MAGVREPKDAALCVEHRVEHGHHALRDLREHAAVDRRQGRAWRLTAAGLMAEDCPRHRHAQRRRQPFAGNIADHNPLPAIADREKVVQIAAEITRGHGGSADLPAGQPRHRLKQ